MGSFGATNCKFGVGAIALVLSSLAVVACGQVADSNESEPHGGSAGTSTTPSSGGSPGSAAGGSTQLTGGTTGLVLGGAPPVVSTPSGGSPGTPIDTASGGAATRPPSECNLPRQNEWGGGFVLCGDGSSRRPEAAACRSEVPRPAPGSTCHAGDECCFDADCAAAPYGYCSYGACLYGCVSDADCASDNLCLCQEPVGKCVPTLCHSDAECPPEVSCSANAGPRGFFCPSGTGSCTFDFECPSRQSCQAGACVPLPG